MTSQHTQGEWKVGLDDEYADGCSGIEIVDPYGSVIAYAVAAPDEGITDEVRANARLIAAAPTLLKAALRGIMALETNGAPNCEAAKELRAAIREDAEKPLLPCPFCGYKHPTISVRENENGRFFDVTCGNCGVMHDLHDKMNFAVEAWNMRTHHPEALQSAFNAGAGATRQADIKRIKNLGLFRQDNGDAVREQFASAIRNLPLPEYGGAK